MLENERNASYYSSITRFFRVDFIPIFVQICKMFNLEIAFEMDGDEEQKIIKAFMSLRTLDKKKKNVTNFILTHR